MSSLWLLHENFSRAVNPVDAYGADRVAFERLGMTEQTAKADVIALCLIHWRSSLAGEDAQAMDLLYSMAESSRSTVDNCELVLYPTALTLVVAEGMISPEKV